MTLEPKPTTTTHSCHSKNRYTFIMHAARDTPRMAPPRGGSAQKCGRCARCARCARCGRYITLTAASLWRYPGSRAVPSGSARFRAVPRAHAALPRRVRQRAVRLRHERLGAFPRTHQPPTPRAPKETAAGESRLSDLPTTSHVGLSNTTQKTETQPSTQAMPAVPAGDGQTRVQVHQKTGVH